MQLLVLKHCRKLSDGDTTYYAVTDNTNFEVGLGTINEGTSRAINYTVILANVGGINVFVLNGVNNPVITFVKGFPMCLMLVIILMAHIH